MLTEKGKMIEDEPTLDALDDLLHILFTTQTQLRQGVSLENAIEELNLETKNVEFWPHFESIIKEISKQSTCLALAFDKRPFPTGNSATKLIEEVQKPIMALSKLFHDNLANISVKYGTLCIREIIKTCSELVKSLSDLVIAVKSCKPNLQLRSTGTVWGICDRALVLPRTNVDAFLLVNRQTTSLLHDAIIELQESAQLLQENDAKILASCLAVAKCTKASVVKIQESIKDSCSPELLANRLSISEIDRMSVILEKLSPALDDMATEFYLIQERENDQPPDNDLIGEAENLGNFIKNVLELFVQSKWYKEERDKERIEFLMKVPDHNLEKLKMLLK